MAAVNIKLSELREGRDFEAGKKHSLNVLSTLRVRLVGMFFDLNKCFMLPSAIRGIKAVKRLYEEHPECDLLVVGHTDTSGKDAYNETLSLERADAIAAYLKDDTEAWLAFFGTDKPKEKIWGNREVQHMLTKLPEGGKPHFSGTPNGAVNGVHVKAVKDFQSANQLKVDGIAGPKTRAAIVKAYMSLDKTSLPEGIELTTHGCGEAFPVDDTTDGVRSPENRRVEIFFFDDGIDPKPAGKVSKKGSKEYPKWLEQVNQTTDILLGDESTTASLVSDYALRRFEIFAGQMDEERFAEWGTVAFGSDIPVSAFKKLHGDLGNKAVPEPDIQLVPGGVDGEDSAYDNATRTVGIMESIAVEAKTVDDQAGHLVALLLHEFGHHVDNLLRDHYSQVGGDAKGEEGAAFAFAIAAMHHVEEDSFTFATLLDEEGETELKLDIQSMHQAAKEYLADPDQQLEAKKETIEFFGAGRGAKNKQFPNDSFGHQSIEDGLGDADANFFSNDPVTRVRDQIYFGNWLRDYSQFLDPAWMIVFENKFIRAGSVARDCMTNYLDLMAKSEFEPTVTPSAHESGVFKVTRAKCGVYRPEEHIDNPQGIANGSAIDPLFHGPVAPGELDVDANTGMKTYIRSSGKGFVTATDFVERSLRAAVAAQITPEGRRLFGQALHTIEDLYAHSNFVELALIRLGHKDVHPWVGQNAKVTVIRDGQPQVWIPMVTGTFGSADTVISACSAIGESLEEEIKCQAGVFSPLSIVAINFMKAMSPDKGDAIESLFARVKELERKYPKYAEFSCNLTRGPREFLRAEIGAMMREYVKNVGKYEQDVLKDPNHTAPSHSMLAKDHDDHPLHAIAAQCARQAVKEMGIAMRDAWLGGVSPDDLVAQAKTFFVHPNDIVAAQSLGPGGLLAKIKVFADANPKTLLQLNRANSEARFLHDSLAEREKSLDEASRMYARDELTADRIATALA